MASGDGFTRRFDEIVAHIPNKTKCIDDTLLWADNIEQAFWQTVQWLDTCGRNGITQNPDKFVFAKDTVEFAGFEISPTSVKPCSKVSQAIKDFPIPRNVTDIRSWFGLVNQVAYAFAVADHMQPFRDLLKPDQPFAWTEHLDHLFKQLKIVIIDQIRHGVEIFDQSRPTCLATDWSKEGLGYWLVQKHCDCAGVRPFCCKSGWKVVLIGSRFTHGAESRYAPIEGEALAVVDALNKARHFTLGCSDLMVAVDHKPLLKVLGDRALDDIPNPRLRNIKEKSLRYRFRVLHIPGVRNTVADTLSRHPVGVAETPDMPNDVAAAALAALRSRDPDMSALVDAIHNGFPDTPSAMPSATRTYYQYREKITEYDGVILYKDRIVIPPTLRASVLQALHSAHQGVSMMVSRAEGSFFWPGMTSAIEETRARCTACNRMAPSQPNPPPTPPTRPVYPFQAICADYFSHGGHHYLVAVDRYSNWPIVEENAEGSKGIISALRRVFVTFGIAEELSSDGGPEFKAGATKTFLKNWGIRHRISSVANPHSNCRAEVGVKTVKRMLVGSTGLGGSLNTDAFQQAMLAYRNTPDPRSKVSPAEIIFGRRIRDFIPVPPGQYLPHWTWRETLQAREDALRIRHMRAHERLSEHTRVLPPLIIGNCVRLQNLVGPHPTKWDRTGIVVEVRQYDQYVIRVDGSGRVTLCNRKHLRQYTPHIARAPLINSPSVIPLATTMPPSPMLPETPTQPADPVSPLPRPTTPVPATPARPESGAGQPPRASREMLQLTAPPPTLAVEVTPPTPVPSLAVRRLGGRTRQPPRRLVEEM